MQNCLSVLTFGVIVTPLTFRFARSKPLSHSQVSATELSGGCAVIKVEK